jgi:hypothetical protein
MRTPRHAIPLVLLFAVALLAATSSYLTHLHDEDAGRGEHQGCELCAQIERLGPSRVDLLAAAVPPEVSRDVPRPLASEPQCRENPRSNRPRAPPLTEFPLT